MRAIVLGLLQKQVAKVSGWAELVEFLYDTPESRKVAESARRLFFDVEIFCAKQAES